MIDAKLSEDPTPEIAAAAQSLNVSIRTFTNGNKDFNYRVGSWNSFGEI